MIFSNVNSKVKNKFGFVLSSFLIIDQCINRNMHCDVCREFSLRVPIPVSERKNEIFSNFFFIRTHTLECPLSIEHVLKS